MLSKSETFLSLPLSTLKNPGCSFSSFNPLSQGWKELNVSEAADTLPSFQEKEVSTFPKINSEYLNFTMWRSGNKKNDRESCRKKEKEKRAKK